MKVPFTTELPDKYNRLIQVGSLEEMFSAVESAGSDVNLIVWRRGALEGDFNTLAECLSDSSSEDKSISYPELYLKSTDIIQPEDLSLRSDFSAACAAIYKDIKDLAELRPGDVEMHTLRSVGHHGYEEADIHDFHSDQDYWRFMACYSGLGTEWIKNEDSIKDDTRDGFYYAAEDAAHYHFQEGDVWLQSGEGLTGRAPFLHRAPDITFNEGDKPQKRLMYVADLAMS
tara:strand:- start:5 stop:691 length:687 start_codon:yes stop_codon:yes gene_type:complete